MISQFLLILVLAACCERVFPVSVINRGRTGLRNPNRTPHHGRCNEPCYVLCEETPHYCEETCCNYSDEERRTEPRCNKPHTCQFQPEFERNTQSQSEQRMKVQAQATSHAQTNFTKIKVNNTINIDVELRAKNNENGGR